MKNYGRPTRRKPRRSRDEWLVGYYGTTDHDYPDIHAAGPRGPDRNLLLTFLCLLHWPGERSLVEELDARGYDVTTLRFEIKRKSG